MEERIQRAVGKEAVIRRPPNPAFGDFSVFVGPESAEKTVRDIRDELGASAKKVEVAGKGFVNITLSREVVTIAVVKASAQGDGWGKGTANAGKRIIVEYSNPNAFKEMHIGHLVGTVVGEAVARLIENSGATIARDTFGGDIGPNVAKALWALRTRGITEPETAEEIGSAYAEGARACESDPKAKEEIDALNQAMYAGTDRALMELWRKGRELSMQEFRRLWRILGTRFDFEFFDSDTTETGMRVVNDGLAKGIFEKSDGAIIYNGEKKGVHTMVFITSHGTPTYEAKDLGLAFLKEERWPSDVSVIVTGNEQLGRFKTVLAALADIAPLLAAKTTHLATGFLKRASGKMSSREGNIITAAEFIREVIAQASEKNADPLIAEQVAVGAIKYMILRQAPGSDILFDAAKSLSLEGDSGPYLQYALVRARSVLAQAKEQNDASAAGAPATPYLLERLLLHFPGVAARAARTFAPNLLTSYLTELAGAWNAFYATERIIGGDHEAHKLLVARAFAQTMSNGLTILGIPAPEKM
ncbi:TPA: arginine--tRNA ligase [Candidatus Kaiserbacteria bacterium]|nr:MAG: Arginine-tRNA ligase [Parcubacteria group bacterium GW2011_GWA1_56_13]KKW47044.1 MAG: Arginine-tRNA ligase [Parcubacteria group bacterium GW2011_GWB1_57_6]HCR52186.1 arginine--tRNA ligase [Candidatus Kaiserbacteria bacterium]